jgi:hypothetical protein
MDLPEDIKLPWYRPRGWTITLDAYEYHGKNWHAWQERLRRKVEAKGRGLVLGMTRDGGSYAGSEIKIVAKNRRVAQGALKLIWLGYLLSTREVTDVEKHYVIPPDNSEPWPEDHPAYGERRPTGVTTHGLTIAALIGARLSQRKVWQSAAWSYYYACKMCPVTWRDTHPYYSDYRPIAKSAEEFVLYAKSIATAYSVIEDLGLEIRASPQNPSAFPNGTRNSKVLDNLRTRLEKAGVDPDWQVVWRVRNARTRLSNQRPVLGAPAEWARSSIRDKMISTVDALYHASFLRSKASAHASNRLTRSLSIYDVENVQDLARCILMQAIGCG